MKRFFIDWLGNYIFFVPIVLLFNAWQWPLSAVMVYMLTSILLAAITGRLFTLFLTKVWYRIWKVQF